MKSRPFTNSLADALRGIVQATRRERNLRVHLLIAALVVVLAVAMRFAPLELAVLSLTIGLVITAELINTAIEAAIDLAAPERHSLAQLGKDAAAGAVLCAAAVSVAVGGLLFLARFHQLEPAPALRPAAGPVVLSLAGLAAATVLVIVVKAARRPFRLAGGLPSAHAACAFALATATFFVSESGLPAVFAAVLAALVAQSRVEGHIHSWFEVGAGALLGTLAMALVFMLFL